MADTQERTVQVPVSLAERAVEALLKTPSRDAVLACDELHALLSRPTPAVGALTSEQASEQMYQNMVDATPAAECGKVMPHEPHLWATETTLVPWDARRCSGAGTEQGRRMAIHAESQPIVDLVPGTTFTSTTRQGFTQRFERVGQSHIKAQNGTVWGIRDSRGRCRIDPSTIRDVVTPAVTSD